MTRLPGHVALNAVFLRPRMGGLETYVRAVVPELMALAPGTRFSVFTGPQGVEALRDEPWAPGALQTHPLLGKPGLKAVTELTLLGSLAPRRGVGLLHSVAMTGPLRTRAAHVVTLPDTTWLTHADPGEIWTARLWRAIVPPVARRADRVIAISQAGKDDVVQRLRVPTDRVDVVHLGFGASTPPAPTPAGELRASLELGDGPVVLTVSAKKVHKNLLRLVQAMRTVADRHRGAVLVLPGNPTEHESELKAEAARLGLDGNVRFPAYVSGEDLEGLYALASVFVFPSLNEGFGLPVLEAMRRGVPVASSNTSSLPEAGGDAARYFDPLDTGAIAVSLLELLEHPGDLVERGRAHAAAFTWRRCAEGTLTVYERAWAARG
jgi:glycosyltransferase involved in cell wall biosynthesis